MPQEPGTTGARCPRTAEPWTFALALVAGLWSAWNMRSIILPFRSACEHMYWHVNGQ